MSRRRMSLDDLFASTKRADSYDDIADRANLWLIAQSRFGRRLGAGRITGLQVMLIFEGMISQPAPVYLEALCAVQGVPLEDAMAAAGYSIEEIRRSTHTAIGVSDSSNRGG